MIPSLTRLHWFRHVVQQPQIKLLQRKSARMVDVSSHLDLLASAPSTTVTAPTSSIPVDAITVGSGGKLL
jgi:hypothetical protein